MTDAAPIQTPAEPLRPTLSFKSVTFSDGSTLTFEDDDIVVFVGPNNAGKSATLREMDSMIRFRRPGLIVHSASTRKTGDADSLRQYLEKFAQRTGTEENPQYAGINFNIHHTQIEYFDRQGVFGNIVSFFAKLLATETRIQDSNAAHALALYRDPPTHPIHMLLMDENLTADMSAKFRHAFGVDLIPFRAGGGNFPLYVGVKPGLAPGKDELSRDFVEELRSSCVPLDGQGDGMRSFAAVLLHILAANNHSIQFLDEPEAFLHPPQARLLGKYIAEGRRSKSQLFIATHSADILDGLIEGGADKVRIIRIRRDGSINRVKELSKSQTREVARDTLTKYSRVFDGIFFEHVVVCESDADCMFYQSILNLHSISGDRRPDVLFVHTSGKHRMAKLASTLKALDVPVSVIADIDVLSEENTFKILVEKLNGTWSEIRPHWNTVSQAVLSQRPPLNATQIQGMIASEIEGVSGIGEFPQEKERAIKNIFKSVSPWSVLKQSGRRGLPKGAPTTQYDQLTEKCAAIGLWIVPVGEVEGFCQSLGSHGPSFVEKVLETKNLEDDPELAEARDFIGKLWRKARS
jgi:energy-coupling factor transporter ATP-binding protein EcfA2